MSPRIGWLFVGLSRVGFQIWQCLKCGVQRQAPSVPEDWTCPTKRCVRARAEKARAN